MWQSREEISEYNNTVFEKHWAQKTYEFRSENAAESFYPRGLYEDPLSPSSVISAWQKKIMVFEDLLH